MSWNLRIGNKTPLEGVTETKVRAETKGWTIWRLPYPGIHPIMSLQTLTPLYTLAKFCWKDPDIPFSCEAMLGPSKHRSGCSQSAIWWITGLPMEKLERVPRELRWTATLWVEQQYELTSTPRACVSSCICSRGWPSRPSVGGKSLGLAKIICPIIGEWQGQEAGVGGLGSRAVGGYKGLWGSHLKCKWRKYLIKKKIQQKILITMTI